MIDFQNGSFFKLKPGDVGDVMPMVQPMLVEGESVLRHFRVFVTG